MSLFESFEAKSFRTTKFSSSSDSTVGHRGQGRRRSCNDRLGARHSGRSEGGTPGRYAHDGDLASATRSSGAGPRLPPPYPRRRGWQARGSGDALDPGSDRPGPARMATSTSERDGSRPRVDKRMVLAFSDGRGRGRQPVRLPATAVVVACKDVTLTLFKTDTASRSRPLELSRLDRRKLTARRAARGQILLARFGTLDWMGFAGDGAAVRRLSDSPNWSASLVLGDKAKEHHPRVSTFTWTRDSHET